MKHLLSQVLLGSGLLLPVGASHAQTTWSIGPQVGTNFANCRSAGASNSGYRIGGYPEGPGSQAKLYLSTNLAVDASGVLCVADWGNGCLRRIELRLSEPTT